MGRLRDLINAGQDRKAAQYIRQFLGNIGGGGGIVNEEETPGASQYYGTDVSGVKGYFDLPGASSQLTTNKLGISPVGNINPDFIVFATAIIRPSNTYVLNQPITWEVLDTASSHGSSFYSSVEAVPGNGRVKLNYPQVKNVLVGTASPDEAFAGAGVNCGPTVGTFNMEIAAHRITPNGGVRLTGDGSSNWVKTGATTLLNNETAYATGTSFTVSAGSGGYGSDHIGTNVSYVGTNNYRVRRVFSGLGSFNARFVLVNNDTNADVATVTASDIVLFTGGFGVVPQQVNLATWNASNQAILSTFTNFWVFGMHECWIVASPLTTTSVNVRWQTDYPSATNYKIYRATNSAFTGEVLIHTGTSGQFTDTGLTANTEYFYRMVAVVDGVDTSVSSFRTGTYL